MIEPKKAVQELEEYTQPAEGRMDYVRLDFNENTVGCSGKVIKALRKIKTGDLSSYPEYGNLRKKLSGFLGVKPEQVLQTNGSDEAIKTIMETYIGRGKNEVLLPVPTYSLFGFFARLSGARVKEVLYCNDLAFPTQRVLDSISQKTKIVVIVNPNNPTGTTASMQDLERIIEKAAENDAIALVDEAYFPFYNESTVGLVEKYDNLMVIRTFSKAFGLAGLKIGYIVSNPANIRAMAKVLLPAYTVNYAACACISAAIDDYDYVKKYVAEVERSKLAFYKSLEKAGIKYYRSNSNFVLINLGDECGRYCEELKKRGILVRSRTNDPLLEGCVRVTIGMKKQMDSLVSSLNEIKSAEKPLLIFDIDGVLVDVSRSYREAIRQTTEFFTGKKISQQEIQGIKNAGSMNNDWDATEAAIKKLGVTVKKARIIEKFQELYLGKLVFREKWLLRKSTLERLSGKYQLAILTGRPRAEAEYALVANGVRDFFPDLIAMEDVEKGKPDPEGLLKITGKYSPEKAFYFGDSVDDMRAAEKANNGIIGIGILPPNDKSDTMKNLLLENSAKKVLKSVNEIYEALE